MEYLFLSAVSGERLVSMTGKILEGLGVSAVIFVLTLLFALPLGFVVAAGRMSKRRPVRWFFQLFISVMRGTPLMLQLFIWYFCPYYLFDISLSDLAIFGIEYRYSAVIIGFSLNYAAYFSEIYRAGIESIPRGQYEAAQVLGYSGSQTFFRIILPQMVKRVLPPVTNETITLVKDTSLAFAIAYAEMFKKAKEIAAAESSVLALMVAGVFYYIFNLLVAWVMGRIEKKMSYYK